MELSTGKTETLVTNLSAKTFPTTEAGALYFKRWSIETKFDSLKNRLQLENMSGRRPVTVYQDFWATVYIANLIASLQYRTDDVIIAKTEDYNNIYAQKTNETRLIKKFRDEFIVCLIEPSKKVKTPSSGMGSGVKFEYVKSEGNDKQLGLCFFHAGGEKSSKASVFLDNAESTFGHDGTVYAQENSLFTGNVFQ